VYLTEIVMLFPKTYNFQNQCYEKQLSFGCVVNQLVSENGQQHVKPFKNKNQSMLPTKDLKNY